MSGVKTEIKFKDEQLLNKLIKEFIDLNYNSNYNINNRKNLYKKYELKNQQDFISLLSIVNNELASIDYRNLKISGVKTENLLKVEDIINFIKSFSNEDNSINSQNLPKGFTKTGVLSGVVHLFTVGDFPIINSKAINTFNFFCEESLSNQWSDYLNEKERIALFGEKILESYISQESIKPCIAFDRFAHWFTSNYGGYNFESKNMIFYGPPGTGKTFSIMKRLKLLLPSNQNDNNLLDSEFVKFVVFHPSYTYEDFIEGIKPAGIKNGNIELKLTNGIFKEFCKKAYNDKNNSYYFIVDEINRANLSNVLGEVLYCLEYRNEFISTQYANLNTNEDSINGKEKAEAKFCVPDNIYFIGTMNDVDKSIDAFDLALRRRFSWHKMEYNPDVIKEIKMLNKKIGEDSFENIESYIECCNSLNNYIVDVNGLNLPDSYKFGHAIFMNINKFAKTKKIGKNNIEDLFENHIYGTLKEYLRSFEDESSIENKVKDALDNFVQNLSREYANSTPKDTKKQQESSKNDTKATQ
jgi:5-methylcytosine-specific restriction protein B